MPKQLAECDASGDREIADPDGWHELAVANPAFLLEPRDIARALWSSRLGIQLGQFRVE